MISIRNRERKKTIVDQAGEINAPTMDETTERTMAPITAPVRLPIPPRTTSDIIMAIHSQCLEGKKLKIKLTSAPADPANAQPIPKEIRQTNLTLTPTSSAEVLFCEVALIAMPKSEYLRNTASPTMMTELTRPEYN
jgi:hypothetical protein